MWQNLYQKTIYEVYKSKEHLNYKIFEFEKMFVVLWNDQQLSYFNMAHCHQFGQEELDIIKKNIPETFMCIASNLMIKDNLEGLIKGTPSDLMVLKTQKRMKENKPFEILRVTNKETLSDFCDVATTVYDKSEDKKALMQSYLKELDLDTCFRYVGYVDGQAAGTVDFSEGKDATCVSWGAVKKEFRQRGLYKAMLIHAINNEIDKGINTIVLNSSEIGKPVYEKMGFVPLTSRYNYVLKK